PPLRQTVSESRREPLPERVMRRVGHRHLLMHSPLPGILHGERHRLASSVPLKGQYDLLAAALIEAGQERRGTGLDLMDGIDRGERRQLSPARGYVFFLLGDLDRRM